MQTGTYISGVGHLGLIGWMVFGGLFQSEPLPFEIQEVTVISSAEFAALTAPPPGPDPVEQPAALTQPDISSSAPDLNSDLDNAPDQTVPEPQAQPDLPEPEPVVPTPPALPDPVVDQTPQPEQPTEDIALLQPPVSARPASRPVDRVAPTPVAPPAPDATPDEVVQQETTSDTGADNPVPDQEETAPEEAVTEIVTEADETAEVSVAPSSAPRPPARPNFQRSAPAETVETAQPAPDPEASAGTDAAVNAALAEALGGADTPAPSGPPLTTGEKDALRVAVSRCWNVGSLSSSALATTVIVGVELTQDGRPVTSSIRMISSSGGDSASAQQAFGAARRAIVRCGVSGFELPEDKYAHWRDIEMTFNPERMRIK